jgi:hypothetical protein
MSTCSDSDIIYRMENVERNIKNLRNECRVMLSYDPDMGTGSLCSFREPIVKFLDKPTEEITMEEFDHMWAYIKYRSDQFDKAWHIVYHFDLAFPGDSGFLGFNRRNMYYGIEESRRDFPKKAKLAYHKLLDAKVFDEPSEGTGDKWDITEIYVAVAVALTSDNMEQAERIVNKIIKWNSKLASE